MSEEIILSKKKIQFADADSTKSGLNFGSGAFYSSSLVNVQGGLVVEGSEVGASTTSFTGATDLGDVSEDQIKLTGSVSGNILRIQPDSNGVTHDLIFPSSLGTSGQFLKNNGTGRLSFGEIVTGYGTNHSWNFGVTKQLWSSAYGSPFVVTPDISPVAPISKSSNLPHLMPGFASVNYNRDISFGNFSWTSSVLSWDQGTSSTHWDMRVSVRFASTSIVSSASPGAIGGSFFLFGNDTLESVSGNHTTGVMPTGGSPSNSTGIAVVFDLNSAASTRSIQILENGIVTKTIAGLVRMHFNLYFHLRIQRRGNILRIEKPSIGDNHFIHEHTLQPNAVFSGTRWGMASTMTGSTHVANLCYVECRALEE